MLSKSTVRRYIMRNTAVLRCTKEKSMNSKRCHEKCIDYTCVYIEDMKDIQERFKINNDHLVNADETWLRGGKDHCQITRIEARYKSGGSEKIDTNASIELLTPFVSSSHSILVLGSATGLLDSKLWNICITHFIRTVKKCSMTYIYQKSAWKWLLSGVSPSKLFPLYPATRWSPSMRVSSGVITSHSSKKLCWMLSLTPFHQYSLSGT